MKLVITLLVILISIDYAFARQKCSMDVETSNISLTWGSYSSSVPATVTMRRKKNANNFLCYLYSYGFGPGNSGSFEQRYLINDKGEKINYNIYKATDNRNKLREIDEVSQTSEAIWGWNLSRNVNYANQFDLKILADQNAKYPSGTYTDSIPVRLYSGLPFNDAVLEDSRTMSISLVIPPEIALSLVDVGSPFDPSDTYQVMDFGELSTGESLEADLKVLSNSGYRVYMESENKGNLKNTVENSNIKYDLYLNNKKKNLNKKKKVAEGNNSTPVSGDNYRIEVRIGNVSGAKAGTYTDNITITAEAK